MDEPTRQSAALITAMHRCYSHPWKPAVSNERYTYINLEATLQAGWRAFIQVQQVQRSVQLQKAGQRTRPCT